jgi:23S rRNA (guanosine2251-2'-O)-methyltransferase
VQVRAIFILARSADSPSEASPEASGQAFSALKQAAAQRGLPLLSRSRSELDRLCRGGVHQGVLALCGAYRYADGVSALLENAAQSGAAPLLLVLDGITDPQNLGALTRSAFVLGGHGMVVPKDRAAAVTPAAVKAAAGATELLPIALVPNLVRAMHELKDRGVWLIAAVAPGQGGVPPWELDLTQPSALCLGSEGQGLRPLVRKTCELRVEIPMLGGLRGASLNVAAAGAALLYEALRQRH